MMNIYHIHFTHIYPKVMFKNKPMERPCKPAKKLKSSYCFYRRSTKLALNFAMRV